MSDLKSDLKSDVKSDIRAIADMIWQGLLGQCEACELLYEAAGVEQPGGQPRSHRSPGADLHEALSILRDLDDASDSLTHQAVDHIATELTLLGDSITFITALTNEGDVFRSNNVILTLHDFTPAEWEQEDVRLLSCHVRRGD